MTLFLIEWVFRRMLLAPSDVADEAFRAAVARLDLTPYARTVAMSAGTGQEAGIESVLRVTVPRTTGTS